MGLLLSILKSNVRKRKEKIAKLSGKGKSNPILLVAVETDGAEESDQ